MRLAVWGLCSALAFAASPATALNKCTGPDGAVTFTDQPCSGTAVSVETLSPDPNANIIDSRPARNLLERERARDEARARARSRNAAQPQRRTAECLREIDSAAQSNVSVGRRGGIIASIAGACGDARVIAHAREIIQGLDMSPGRKACLLSELRSGSGEAGACSSRPVAIPRSATRSASAPASNVSPPSVLAPNPAGAIDVHSGRFYPRTGPGLTDPRTGEFLPKSGPGYIRPSTGQFMPAH
ncbi:DUF4124 domain-containing protein [Thiohalocapsa halophila]